jgi:hypothetical protein
MWRRLTLSVLLPVALLLSGCSATGMGWIQSSLDPTAKATFGFSFDGTTQTFSGSYHDPQGRTGRGVVDVSFKGTGKLNPCSTDLRCQQLKPPTKGDCVFGEPPYQSQNPAIPGDGLVFLEICDLDGNAVADTQDSILIIVDTGPYAGYTNGGNPHGNITVKQ